MTWSSAVSEMEPRIQGYQPRPCCRWLLQPWFLNGGESGFPREPTCACGGLLCSARHISTYGLLSEAQQAWDLRAWKKVLDIYVSNNLITMLVTHITSSRSVNFVQLQLTKLINNMFWQSNSEEVGLDAIDHTYPLRPSDNPMVSAFKTCSSGHLIINVNPGLINPKRRFNWGCTIEVSNDHYLGSTPQLPSSKLT